MLVAEIVAGVALVQVIGPRYSQPLVPPCCTGDWRFQVSEARLRSTWNLSLSWARRRRRAAPGAKQLMEWSVRRAREHEANLQT